jgi:integrase/recombinase XerD
MNFSALLAAYFEDLRVKNWSEATINRRQHSLNRFCVWLQDRSVERIDAVTPDLIAAYQRNLYYQGNLRTKKPLRSATQASYLSAVAHWLQWCCLRGHLAFNPAVGLELPKEEVRLPMNYLTVEEVESLINQTDTTQEIGIRDRAILEILYSSAIRRNELLALGLYDIDRSRRLLMIRQGKGKRDRVVPIGLRALQWLEKYLLEVRPWLMAGNGRKRLGNKPEESDRIFLGTTGKPISPVQLSQLVRGYLESAEIKKSGACHVLRHTAATLMLENGADLRSLQTLLGHASLNTTQVYTHITIDRLRQVHDATHPAKPDQRPEA